MCCGVRICMFCTCLVLAVIVIGFLFGFGVFKHGFHKLEDTLHACDPAAASSCGGSSMKRPFLGFNAPPPY